MTTTPALNDDLVGLVRRLRVHYLPSRHPTVNEAAAALEAQAKEIEALRAALEWQPIETAPKDGTRIDLWGINHLKFDKPGERIVNVKWGPVMNWMGTEREDWQHGRGEDYEPTHWMPHPTPPIARTALKGA